ncbi:hypothetical protein [Gelidibacter maritimus]|uniref:Uncharacterized protein n=1 Tax=Gelidibacter maritimus TaxID=2761487 RepID=A0A7W2R566_9FLAO|nr:hypothetical protein [Gelidibacter maritimus]MBA6154589.1 hypothetical protein [Gelidibacter maritimus]
MKQFILHIFIGLTFLACSKDDDATDRVFVLYNQTYCSDPWEPVENKHKLIDRIKNYFESVNIGIADIKIDNKGTPQFCNACHCLSGNRVIATVSKDDLDAIKEFGFQEYN